MKEFFKQIKISDIIIPSCVLFITAVFSYFIFTGSSGERKLIVKSPQGEWIYPLDTDKEIFIQGALGITEINIKNGEAGIKDSACPHKTCTQHGGLKNPGDWNACLPNKVFLYIEGS